MDSLGLIIGVVVHSAGIQDRDGAKKVVEKIRFQCPLVEKLYADGGYAGKFEQWCEDFTQWVVEIVKRSDKTEGFVVLPKRWVVERTFAWLSRYRRLSKDYEYLAQTAENMIYIAMINLMLHRLAPEKKNHNYLPKNLALAA